MARNNALNFNLPSVDDLFSTEESRADAQREVFPSALTGAFLCR